jgi:hypothetical protein
VKPTFKRIAVNVCFEPKVQDAAKSLNGRFDVQLAAARQLSNMSPRMMDFA